MNGPGTTATTIPWLLRSSQSGFQGRRRQCGTLAILPVITSANITYIYLVYLPFPSVPLCAIPALADFLLFPASVSKVCCSITLGEGDCHRALGPILEIPTASSHSTLHLQFQASRLSSRGSMLHLERPFGSLGSLQVCIEFPLHMFVHMNQSPSGLVRPP